VIRVVGRVVSVTVFLAAAMLYERWLPLAIRLVRQAADAGLRGRGAAVPADSGDPAPEPAERAKAVALTRRLERLVGELPEGQRQVLVLRDIYGQSTKEVANTRWG
jgi:DNA-directed RNA polymerase specialized sigma24 family protein